MGKELKGSPFLGASAAFAGQVVVTQGWLDQIRLATGWLASNPEITSYQSHYNTTLRKNREGRFLLLSGRQL